MITTTVFAKDNLPKGIDWQVGKMEVAQTQSKKLQRPIFLYWGAVWCPPCNQIKQTIFTSAEFQQKVKSFIAVYMDGDSPEAQLWADRLKTSGYPTMLILSPEGKELARLPTGVTAKEYAELMQLALEDMRPVSEIMMKALKGNATASEWQRLAGHSWGQDSGVNLDESKLAQVLGQLWTEAKSQNDIIRSRLLLQWLVKLAEEKTEGPISRQQKKLRLQNMQEIKKVVENFQLYSANRELLNWSFEDIYHYFKPLLPAQEKIWAEVEMAWLKNAQNVSADQQCSLDDRMSAMIPAISWENINHPNGFSKELQDEVKEKAAWASKTASSEYERQAVMSTVVYALKSAGLVDDAKSFALNELKKSKSAHYFMSMLAGIEKKQGNMVAAREWSIKAWQEAKGVNSQFQWGISMLEFLLQQDGDQNQELYDYITKVSSPMLQTSEAFNGRNQKRFNALGRALKAWLAKGTTDQQAARKSQIQKSFNEMCSKSLDQKKCLQVISF